jgi:hypothetical protein
MTSAGPYVPDQDWHKEGDRRRAIEALLETAGLVDVGAAGRLHVYRGGGPQSAFARLTLESFAGALLEAGDLTQPDLDQALAKLRDPDTVFVTAPMIAAWGRRPV